MHPTLSIRKERAGDAESISDVVRRTYRDVRFSDHREHLMVDRLRHSAGFVPELSLVAEMDGEAVGHVLLTRAAIRGATALVETLALAPLSVVPEFRRQGVGRRLVEASHRVAGALGFGSIVLIGLPDYSPRFGYRPLGHHPITLPFPVAATDCMILALRPGALDGVSGTVEYASGWLDH